MAAPLNEDAKVTSDDSSVMSTQLYGILSLSLVAAIQRMAQKLAVMNATFSKT